MTRLIEENIGLKGKLLDVLSSIRFYAMAVGDGSMRAKTALESRVMAGFDICEPRSSR